MLPNVWVGLLHMALEDLGIDLPYWIIRLQLPEIVHRHFHAAPHQSVEAGLKPLNWVEELESEVKDEESLVNQRSINSYRSLSRLVFKPNLTFKH